MQTATELQNIDAKKYKRITDVLIQIMKNEGFRKGLFKGFSINCIRTPIGKANSQFRFLPLDGDLRSVKCQLISCSFSTSDCFSLPLFKLEITALF